MARENAFVDESKRADYVVVAVMVALRELEPIRKELRGLLLPGQRALHFKDERSGRRKQILGHLGELPLSADVYVSRERRAVAARRACLEALVADLADRDRAERLVLELADGDFAADKRTLYAASRKHSARFTYHHVRAPQEPILWVADAFAWAWSHGGSWRARVSGSIESVVIV